MGFFSRTREECQVKKLYSNMCIRKSEFKMQPSKPTAGQCNIPISTHPSSPLKKKPTRKKKKGGIELMKVQCPQNAPTIRHTHTHGCAREKESVIVVRSPPCTVYWIGVCELQLHYTLTRKKWEQKDECVCVFMFSHQLNVGYFIVWLLNLLVQMISFLVGP